MIVPCAFVGKPQSVALLLPFQNSSFKRHAFHSPPENMEMWVFSLVKIEFHATNQIKKRRHVFQRTYRCCARPWSYSCFRCVFCRSYLSLNLIAGFQVKRAFTLPPDWKANVPYTLDSVARYSYQKPNPQEELQVPITRYGSNRKKAVAATGTSKTPASKYDPLFSLSVCHLNKSLFFGIF